MHRSSVMRLLFWFSVSWYSLNAFAADVINPEYDFPSSSPKWVIGEVVLSVEVSCHIATNRLLPTKECSNPSITIEKVQGRDNSLHSFELSVGDVRIGYAWETHGKVMLDDMWWGTRKSEQLFKILKAAPDTQLTFKSIRSSEGNSTYRQQAIVLADFDEVTNRLIDYVNRDYDQVQADRRYEAYVARFVLITIVVFAVWVGVVLFKYAKLRLQTAKEASERRRVTRIAEDEAIREVVRSSVKETSEEKLLALKSQIKAALDAGDTEIAEKLIVLLRKSTASSGVD